VHVHAAHLPDSGRYGISIQRARDVLRGKGIAAAIACAAIVVGLGFKLRIIALPIETLTARYLADDYFYYLNVALNITQGLGSSFDGGLTFTNGYQPLFLWMLAGVFALGASKTAAVHIGLVIQAVAAVVAAAIAYRVVAMRNGPWVATWAAGLLSLNLFFVLPTLTGFEMALSLAAAMLALWLSQRGTPSVIVGMACGLALLARVDNLSLAAALGAVLLFQRRWRDVLLLVIGVVIVSGPWATWNLIYFGHPLPDSGVVKAHYRGLGAISHSAATAFAALPRILLPGRFVDWMAHNTPWLSWALAVVVSLIAAPAAIRKENRALALFAASLLAAYLVLIDPNEPGALVRYLYPVWAVLALLIAHSVRPLVAAIILALHAADVVAYTHWERTAPVPSSYVGVASTLAPAAIASGVPPGAPIAAFDAGALGYFAPRQVVNLDGLANHDIIELRRSCGLPYPECLKRYLASKGLQILAGGTAFGWTQHFAGWQHWTRIYESPPLVDGSKLVLLRIPEPSASGQASPTSPPER
jgi:hypothetical protein